MVKIREGNPNDANDFVYVNTHTWISTYKGLLPDELLDDLSDTIEARVPKTKDRLEKENNLIVAECNGLVVGVLTYNQSRDTNYPNAGEISSIYVLKEYQGNGIGSKLFQAGLKKLINQGFKEVILKVLKENKGAIEFYQKKGGIIVGEEQANLRNYLVSEYIIYFDFQVDK